MAHFFHASQSVLRTFFNQVLLLAKKSLLISRMKNCSANFFFLQTPSIQCFFLSSLLFIFYRKKLSFINLRQQKLHKFPSFFFFSIYDLLSYKYWIFFTNHFSAYTMTYSDQLVCTF